MRDARQEKEVLDDRPLRSDVEKGTDSQSDDTSEKSYLDAATTAKKQWIGTSSESPRNWPLWRKWWVISGLLFYCTIIFVTAVGYNTDETMMQYGVSEQLSVLGQSMYILGVAIGVSGSLQCCSERRQSAAVYTNNTCSRCSWRHCPKYMVDSRYTLQASSSSPSYRYQLRSRQHSPVS